MTAPNEQNDDPGVTALEALMITNAQQALDAVNEILNAPQAQTGTRESMALTANHAVIAAFALIANTPENGMTGSAQSLINAIHDRCLAAMQDAGDAPQCS